MLLRVAGVSGFSDDLRGVVAIHELSADLVDHIWLVVRIMDPLSCLVLARVTILSIVLID